jgi:hypothetical protein
MKTMRERFNSLGLEIPDLLLPRKNIDLEKWAVIACDQFTQDRDYWEKAKVAACGAPSTLNLIFPEVFLSCGDEARRIANIHSAMKDYLEGGIFGAPLRGCVYLERDTPFHRGRRGLVMAVDLERYNWSGAARSLIRSTEGTVAERLPPRMDIRRGAPLEIPHVLLLIDDDTDSLLPALGERAKKNAPVYQTRLMMDSGGLNGWPLDDEEDLAFFATRLGQLADRALTRYGSGGESGEEPFLFAVGDGNHSLAAARGIWEEYKRSRKTGGGLPEHPCRYALVEIENIYDQAIRFEPIHRIVFGMAFEEALSLLAELPDFSSRPAAGRAELVRLTTEAAAVNRFGLVGGNRYALIETSAPGLATASLQPLLDRAAARNTALAVDYIHGSEELFRLAGAPDRPAAGIMLPPMRKAELFETVARSGPLPRKSFSMGEAREKRFYLECRRLF